MMTSNNLIIGGHGGIGENLALRLKDSNHNVLATMRNPETSSAKLDTMGIKCLKLDITNTESINALAAQISGMPLHGLAYCVGSIDLMPLKSSRDEHFLKAFELNVLGAIRILRALEANLKSGKGSVVLFSSIAATQGFTNHAVIATAKAALEGLAKSLAAEWAPHIRVNVIAPSLSRTPLAEKLTGNEKMASAIASSHPMQRLGEAGDSAALASLLLSPDSSWITGQVIHVDGGRSTLRVPA
jgi:NAD(P)-dependent dehydrogenase (short-subunit alcohol dehydrogenase family)